MPESTAASAALERAVRTIHDRLAEPLTVDDLARAAAFSKFHFSRVFLDATGLSPGRFLAAVRLQEAKRLLLATDESVIDICSRVGYASAGTFSSRFGQCVGLPPRTYRLRGGVGPGPVQRGPARAVPVRGRITGAGAGDLVFVGAFPGPMAQGRPVAVAVRAGDGPVTLHEVPTGRWHVVAHAAGPDGPLTFRGPVGDDPVAIALAPRALLDPPLLTALPELSLPEPIGRPEIALAA